MSAFLPLLINTHFPLFIRNILFSSLNRILFIICFTSTGLTLAQHMLALPWNEELLARSIEKNLYHGRHLTFCRKRDDKLALVSTINDVTTARNKIIYQLILQAADVQNFPNYTALPETKEDTCSERLKTLKMSSSSPKIIYSFFTAILVTITLLRLV